MGGPWRCGHCKGLPGRGHGRAGRLISSKTRELESQHSAEVSAMKCMKAMGPEMDGNIAGPALKKAGMLRMRVFLYLFFEPVEFATRYTVVYH